MTRIGRRHRRSYRYTRNLFFLIVLVGGMVGHIWQMSSVSELSQQIKELKSEKARVEDRNSYRRAEFVERTDIRRIVKIAREKLDMILPQGTPVEIFVKDR